MRFVILLVIIAVAVAAGLGMLWLSGGTKTGAPTAQMGAATSSSDSVATVDVLVARQDIPLGTQLDETMVDRQPWPRNLVLEGFLLAGTPEADVNGMVARGEFKAREPLVMSKLSQAKDGGFLAGQLPQGMRAVTVAVDAISGVAGYILPGDRVDVMFAHSVPQEAPKQLWGQVDQRGSSQKPTTAEVLLPNLRVLAVNTRRAPPKKEGPIGTQQAQEIEPPNNVTLEMTQEEAKKLRLGEKNGTLSLALKSVADAEDSSVGPPVTVLDISQVEGAIGDDKGWSGHKGTAGAFGNEVVIIRGVIEDRVSGFSGARASSYR